MCRFAGLGDCATWSAPALVAHAAKRAPLELPLFFPGRGEGEDGDDLDERFILVASGYEARTATPWQDQRAMCFLDFEFIEHDEKCDK